tara:strand:- start:195 stop:632 length:438 start_codon:yes stop_codon:yes gene_type:complete
MGLVKEISKYGTFFHSIRTHENTFMLDLKLPAYWEVVNLLASLDSNVQTKMNDSNDNHQLVTFYVPKDDEGISNLERTVQSVIKWNKENEEKRELLDTKMIELQKIFETNEVSSLRSLMFDFNNDPTTITPSDDATDETNLKLDE